MNTGIDYEVIESNRREDVCRRVEMRSLSGFRPVGGICVTDALGNAHYFQAVMRERKPRTQLVETEPGLE